MCYNRKRNRKYDAAFVGVKQIAVQKGLPITKKQTEDCGVKQNGW